MVPVGETGLQPEASDCDQLGASLTNQLSVILSCKFIATRLVLQAAASGRANGPITVKTAPLHTSGAGFVH